MLSDGDVSNQPRGTHGSGTPFDRMKKRNNVNQPQALQQPLYEMNQAGIYGISD